MKTGMSNKAFTLIELLIVVAIIAILALIAVPNFLEAQIRAKCARAKADLRGIATAVEAYATDMGAYPRTWYYGYATITPDLTTPVAYLSTLQMYDPFAIGVLDPRAVFENWKHFTLFYTYDHIIPLSEALKFPPNSPWQSGPDAVDGPWPTYNEGALRKYGQWRLISIGPDRMWIINMDFDSMDTPYDPTNGTVSYGNITRTQLSPEGKVFYSSRP
jgi:prepilin-type N-terminal cleavage/methylation domain-containing protein